MNKTSILTVAVLVVIAIGGYAFPRVSQMVVDGEPIGAVASPVINSEYLRVNGVETVYKSQKFNTASTTRCAIQSPTYATSTLSLEGIVKSATTTNYTLVIAKSSTAYATTTALRTEAVTDDTEVAFPTASTTYSSLADTYRTFAPGQYLVVSTTGTATAFDSGSCAAVFTVGAR